MPDAAIHADGAGVIRFWNAGAERIFGFAAAEALGKSLDIIIPERLRARHWAGFDTTMRSGALAPIFADGCFEYVPIPEDQPTQYPSPPARRISLRRGPTPRPRCRA